jgi:hypothetical protein
MPMPTDANGRIIFRNQAVEYAYDDGGRSAAGYKGYTGDCGVRALAIAADIPYQQAYDLCNEFAKSEKPSKTRRGKSSARTGMHSHTYRKVMEAAGFRWVPTMAIGSGCTVHVRASELPPGRIVLNVSKHYAAFVNGVLRDTFDCSRGGDRCVYGYFIRED